MKINLVVALYRDSYFYHDYGSAVRDLQFLATLAEFDEIAFITVINRPVSILERLLANKFLPKKIKTKKISTLDVTSLDIFGAIKGRAWASEVFPKIINKSLLDKKSNEYLNVFLDFLPIGSFEPSLLDGWIYWYDFIDNFKKHNRFSDREIKLVQEKYDFVKENANVITAVSEACLKSNMAYSAEQLYVLSNKVFKDNDYLISALTHNYVPECTKFDFGFIGFITNKFDLDFVLKLAENYTVAIYGQVLDSVVAKKLRVNQNVKLFGKFSYNELTRICNTFKVGLLPYLEKKSHDGSPLKLYEYMKYNLPCLTSIDYEIKDQKYIINYNKSKNINDEVNELFKLTGDRSISASIREDWLLSFNLKKIIDEIK